jgi:hypothetical protein
MLPPTSGAASEWREANTEFTMASCVAPSGAARHGSPDSSGICIVAK